MTLPQNQEISPTKSFPVAFRDKNQAREILSTKSFPAAFRDKNQAGKMVKTATNKSEIFLPVFNAKLHFLLEDVHNDLRIAVDADKIANSLTVRSLSPTLEAVSFVVDIASTHPVASFLHRDRLVVAVAPNESEEGERFLILPVCFRGFNESDLYKNCCIHTTKDDLMEIMKTFDTQLTYQRFQNVCATNRL